MTLERPQVAALPDAPYAQVVVARGSRLVFVSGQVSVDEHGHIVAPGDLAGQTRQAHANLLAALSAAGASVHDIAKLTTYVAGYRPELLPAIREGRAAVLGPAEIPASTLVGVEALVSPDYLIEVEAFAVVGETEA
jgi:enamine deaminase RidA (YjgF/YER057c/UK114 family)